MGWLRTFFANARAARAATFAAGLASAILVAFVLPADARGGHGFGGRHGFSG
jgi:hypothetical protein